MNLKLKFMALMFDLTLIIINLFAALYFANKGNLNMEIWFLFIAGINAVLMIKTAE